MTAQSTKALLSGVRIIADAQKKIESIKGESFNVFSILKVEWDETKAHTPFLANLLSPQGSHGMSSRFLTLFLETIQYQQLEPERKFDVEAARVEINKNIGLKVLDPGNESGGNLDIYIEDGNGTGIVIENKIDPNTEQEKQVVRYCNYRKGKSTVLYLTPMGAEPSEYSCGKLKSNQHYHLISYKNHVITWLLQCLREAAEQPILRESLRQYIVSLKKITFSMDNEEQQKLNLMMLDYFEESGFIAANFANLKEQIGEDIRQEVMKALKKELRPEFEVFSGNKTNKTYSQIWIKHHKFLNVNLFFGIESFSHFSDGALDVGIFSEGGKETTYNNGEKSKESNWWPYYQTMSNYRGHLVDFTNGNTLHKLYTDPEFKTGFIRHIVEESKNFIAEHRQPLLNFYQTNAVHANPTI